jgi:hypothetical protein
MGAAYQLMKKEDELAQEFEAKFEKWKDTAQSPEVKHVRFCDGIFTRLVKRCANPFCKWPIAYGREMNYSAPYYGEICSTCHDMYSALSITNPKLRNPRYFHGLSDQWMADEEKRKKDEKNRRNRLGLDGDGTT